jgi:hypothetical protein
MYRSFKVSCILKSISAARKIISFATSPLFAAVSIPKYKMYFHVSERIRTDFSGGAGVLG